MQINKTGTTADIFANNGAAVVGLLPYALHVAKLAEKGLIEEDAPVPCALSGKETTADVLTGPLQTTVHLAASDGFSFTMVPDGAILGEAANQAVYLATGTNGRGAPGSIRPSTSPFGRM